MLADLLIWTPARIGMIQARICGDRARIAVIGMWEHIGLGFFGIYQTLLTCVLGTSKCISTWCWFATFIIAAITLLLLVFEQSGGHVRIFMHVLCIWCLIYIWYNIYIPIYYYICLYMVSGWKNSLGREIQQRQKFQPFQPRVEKNTFTKMHVRSCVYIYIYVYCILCIWRGKHVKHVETR